MEKFAFHFRIFVNMVVMPIMCCCVGLGIHSPCYCTIHLCIILHKFVVGVIHIGFLIVFMNNVACWKTYSLEIYKHSKGNKTNKSKMIQGNLSNSSNIT